MRKLLVFLGLLGLAAVMAACSGGASNSFTITGEFISVEPETSDTTGTDATDATDEEFEDADEPVVDWSTAKIVVTQEIEGTDGTISDEEIGSATFVDGKFTISGEVEEPTEVTITASVTKDYELSASALLVPGGDEISLVLVDDMREYPTDGLYLLGNSHTSQDSAKKLTIKGDLSNLEMDLNMATIGVYGRRYQDGSLQTFSLGYVMAENGKFTIEADVDDVQVASFYFSSSYTSEYAYSSTRFIAEPNANYDVELRAQDHLFVTSGRGKHAEVIESWEQSAEYQTKFDAYETAFAAYMAEQEMKKEAAERAESAEGMQTDSDVASGTDEEADAEVDTVLAAAADTTSESETEAALQAPSIEPAEGCEHVVIDQTHRSMAQMIFSDEAGENDPESVVLRRELRKMKSEALRRILDESEDPINVLLAMELGAIDPYAENSRDALPVYHRLAEQLDPEIVAQRVTPARNAIVARIEKNENDSSLVQGQKVPEFTLANAEGVDMAIYDILTEREVTLIDFWASWCGPCIATFPDLKRLYAAYNDDGFEIVGVSIDDNFKDWNEASIEHEIPWIDLGELKDWDGPVAVSYGVGFIPKAYLVDSNGCVLKKHVHPDMLEEALVQRFGEMPETDESEMGAEPEADDLVADDVGG